MRKFLAALMAVLMIMAVVAVLPIGAETAPVKSTFDGTTPADANALPLVVTEVMTNTTGGGHCMHGTSRVGSYSCICGGGAFPVVLHRG